MNVKEYFNEEDNWEEVKYTVKGGININGVNLMCDIKEGTPIHDALSKLTPEELTELFKTK